MKKITSIIFVFVFALLCLCSCSVYYTYPRAEEYKVGAGKIEEKVERLDIQWLIGEVQILPAKEGETSVVIEEVSNLDLNETTKVRYLLESTTLKIRFAKSGAFVTPLKKTLRVYLPTSLLSLEINSTSTQSANVRLGEVEIEDCSIFVASGSVRIDGAKITRHFGFEAGSGSLSGYGDCTGSQMDLTVASGTIDFSPNSCDNFDVVAGSGKVTLTLDECPGGGNFSVASGNMTVYLPETSSVTLVMESIIGKFSTDFEYDSQGNYYIIGEGASRFRVRVASGDMQIYKK